jgi:hypothetical protein
MKFQESYFHNEYGLSCVEDYIIYILCKDTFDWPKIFYKSYYDIEEILNYLLFEGQEYSSIKTICNAPRFVVSWIYLYTINWKKSAVTGITAYKWRSSYGL